jgi:hypothetical protein
MIPGWVISLLTAPGVVVHEAAHMLFCRWSKLAILDVCFFRIGNPAGYVIHEVSDSFHKNFLVAMGPFFVNSTLCLLLCFPAFVPVRVFDQADPLSYLLLYLGLSIGMHAIPSNQDASGLWRSAKVAAKKLNPLAIITFPLIILIYIVNLLRFFWADAIYGVAIGFGLPELIFNHLF